MANPTTNYGFVMPTSTDLVTDLPADFDVFGQAVDNQMLTNANAAIAKSIVDAKGDIIAATASDTITRLAVGANNTVLTADSSTATGLKWATPSLVSGLTLISTTTIGTTVSSVTVTGAFSATYDNYKIIVSDGLSSAATCNLALTLGATATGYYWGHSGQTFANADDSLGAANQVSWRAGNGSPKTLNMKVDVLSPFLSTETNFSGQYQISTTTGSSIHVGGFLDNTTSYTAFTITASTGTLTGGTIRVYGYQNS